MYQNRSKLQSGSESNINNKVKEVKTTTTTTVIQTKIEKPKNDYGKLPQASGRSSAVYTIKTNINNVQNKKPNLNDNVSEASSKNADKPKYRWSVANHRFELENPTTTTTTTTTTTNYVKTKNKEEKKPEVKSVTNISTSYSTNYGANKYSVTKKEAAPNVSTTVIRSTSKKDDKKNKPLTTQSKVVKEEVKIVETKKDYIPKVPETKVVKQEVKVVETKKDYIPKLPETKVVKEEVKVVETKKDYTPKVPETKVVKEEVKVVETKKDYTPKVPEKTVVKEEVKIVETKQDYNQNKPQTVVKEEVKIVETKKDYNSNKPETKVLKHEVKKYAIKDNDYNRGRKSVNEDVKKLDIKNNYSKITPGRKSANVEIKNSYYSSKPYPKIDVKKYEVKKADNLSKPETKIDVKKYEVKKVDNLNKPETKVVKQEVKVVETKKDYIPKVPETKVVKQEVKVVETKKDTPIVGAISKYIVNTKKDDGKTTTNNVYNVKTYERKTDNKNNILDKDKNSTVKEVKVTYNYNRDKLGIKTDEDLPQRKNKYKEEVKIEPKKRTTLTTTYTSYTPNPRKSEDKSVKKVVEVKKTQINNINNVNSNVYKAPVNTRVVEKVEKKVEQIPYVPDQREEVNRIEIEEEVDQNGENLDYVDQKEKENRLKIALNEIERVNAEKTLKDEDLVELFEKVLEYNREFKDDIFFKNLNDTHRKVGGMDKVDRRKIPHTFKEIETSKILKNHENAKDLLKKYTYRAKRIVEED